VSVPVKLLAFAGVLAATFAAAYGVGAALDPVDGDPAPAHAPADPEDVDSGHTPDHVTAPGGTGGHP
jgi:hypothetical protein